MPGQNQASCGDPDIESRLEAGINDFCTTMEKRPHADTAQVEVVRNITHLPFGEPNLTGLHEVINLHCDHPEPNLYLCPLYNNVALYCLL
jgi:hypothetical protein